MVQTESSVVATLGTRSAVSRSHELVPRDNVFCEMWALTVNRLKN